ncbi:gamma-glutamylcyclotransferase [Citreicella sp. C3M06]|uniref:gamma-glutamylcyclotransferase n=1 Tax=Roseobacteraceae TaxID=2854170 RepID=UPI001C08ACA5|nr:MULTISPECIES: gamma-glutamylcyclotransferase [Roseobacteraceae]MBU2960617.1 gamma-glutamylcyclotransferase [Citreicella sp. C3M06]MDO6585980.1 gamma-glutamylcyclotransferase [Salipiger sp. 1_MG-2023]
MTLWVFGYGSLLWNPGFEVAETVHATLPDYHRSFCMRSIHHRGTIDTPGLVLALDECPGALCQGLALRAAPGTEDSTLAYLRERELISSAYIERNLAIDLDSGARIEAVTYVIDPHHVQYCGGLPLEEQAQIIANATGGMGPNRQYLENTADHLDQIGIPDAELHWLRARVQHLADNRLA